MSSACLVLRVLAIAAACLALTPQAGHADRADVEIADLGWIAGNWIREEDGTVSEHLWLAPRGQVIVGLQRDTLDGITHHTEFVEIREGPNGIVFHVYPVGQAPTDFFLVWADERRMLFENPDHDFPQRILYWTEGGSVLVARIEGRVNGHIRSVEWRWRRAGKD